jgi:hypothetical protein
VGLVRRTVCLPQNSNVMHHKFACQRWAVGAQSGTSAFDVTGLVEVWNYLFVFRANSLSVAEIRLYRAKSQAGWL